MSGRSSITSPRCIEISIVYSSSETIGVVSHVRLVASDAISNAHFPKATGEDNRLRRNRGHKYCIVARLSKMKASMS